MAKDRANSKILLKISYPMAFKRHFGRPRPALVIALVVGWAAAAFGLQPSTPLASYGRQTWVMENGLPQNTVQALVQGANGFLWIGTEVGLVRFDGNGFQVFDKDTVPALPGNDVHCLFSAQDGALWIGTGDGLARWKDNAIRVFTTNDGLPANSIVGLNAGGSEGLVVKTTAGSAEFKNGRFQPVSMLPEQLVQKSNVAFHSDFLTNLTNGVTAYGSKTDLELHRGGEFVARLAVGKELPGTRIQSVFADREGALWIGTNGGLARWSGGKLQTLPVTDSLSSASILALMEDREGDLWIGTEADGLHILRDQRFRTLGVRDGLPADATTTVVEDGAGTLWVGTGGFGLSALSESPKGAGLHIAHTWTVRDGLASDVILSLAAAPNGDLWVGTPDGLNRIRSKTVDSFTSADGLPDDFIRSLLVDVDGSLWIGTRRGLTHWVKPGSTSAPMDTFTTANGLGSNLVGAMAKGAKGDLWAATFAGLSRFRGGKIENFTTANGLSSNVVTALLVRKNGDVLIGTQDHGWNLWDGKDFTPVAKPGVPSKDDIHAILDDDHGHIWFATGEGLARADCPEHLADDIGVPLGHCLSWLQFGTADGLRGRETAVNSHPSGWRSHDGHLWFATPKGLVEVDPATIPINTVPPAVALERLSIDDAAVPLGESHELHIPAGHVHFEFDYAGLSFVTPQKVRYRYMLEGFDHQWTDAGPRRTAYYTNIPAGTYTFRVQAANNDGLWNLEGAALPFELRPHFYQTWWFYALLILCAAALILLVQRLRLRRAEREFNAVLGERNRIAREIHDTLAQGYVGISVQLEVLSELLRVKKVEAAAKHLDLTRGYVREGLADARQSIWALRSQDSGETTLPVKLRRMVESAGGGGLQSQFGIFGAYRPLAPGTERELLRIAQEAIHNVKKHAAASHLHVQLNYGSNEVNLEVRDDGKGFSVSETSVPGHFGLTGMRERATLTGGSLNVESTPGAGTIVRFHVPATPETRAQAKEQL